MPTPMARAMQSTPTQVGSSHLGPGRRAILPAQCPPLLPIQSGCLWLLCIPPLQRQQAGVARDVRTVLCCRQPAFGGFSPAALAAPHCSGPHLLLCSPRSQPCSAVPYRNQKPHDRTHTDPPQTSRACLDTAAGRAASTPLTPGRCVCQRRARRPASACLPHTPAGRGRGAGSWERSPSSALLANPASGCSPLSAGHPRAPGRHVPPGRSKPCRLPVLT